MIPTIDVTAAGAIATILANLLLSVIKPFVERVPGILLPANQDLHDNLLRLIGYLISYGFLLAALLTGYLPGWNWIALLAVALGPTLTAHVAFKLATAGRPNIKQLTVNQQAEQASAARGGPIGSIGASPSYGPGGRGGSGGGANIPTIDRP